MIGRNKTVTHDQTVIKLFLFILEKEQKKRHIFNFLGLNPV